MTLGAVRIGAGVLAAFVAITAIGGGIALTAGLESARFGPEHLQGTPFRSYVVPGLLLATVVGGSAAIALVAILRDSQEGGVASLLAGALLGAWIVAEIATLNQDVPWTATEAVYLVLAVGMMTLGGLLWAMA